MKKQKEETRFNYEQLKNGKYILSVTDDQKCTTMLLLDIDGIDELFQYLAGILKSQKK